jgi:hypothetical protein
MDSPSKILDVLDSAARAFTFPMLDNGYWYLAATRLSLHRSDEDWAMAIEVFGYSPRSGVPDTFVSMFGSDPLRSDAPDDIALLTGYRDLANHPNDDLTIVLPIERSTWPGHDVDLDTTASTVVLRGKRIRIPDPPAYAELGIDLLDPGRVMAWELCRALASQHRDEVLATEAERRAHVRPQLEQVLVLNEWHHPDLFEELPSQMESFRQLAEVLATGDVGIYKPTESPNTHWSNWPEGGTL